MFLKIWGGFWVASGRPVEVHSKKLFGVYLQQQINKLLSTVDGRNPAPVETCKTLCNPVHIGIFTISTAAVFDPSTG